VRRGLRVTALFNEKRATVYLTPAVHGSIAAVRLDRGLLPSRVEARLERDHPYLANQRTAPLFEATLASVAAKPP
jgi:hypothetical protein